MKLALTSLWKTKVHQAFAGYLCVKFYARSSDTTSVKVDFKGFFDRFLRVPDGTERRPYIMPFNKSENKSPDEIWFNSNPAGSYAGSSVRPQSPIRAVYNWTGSGRNTLFSLLPNHASNARKDMLFNRALPIQALSVFLYREAVFLADAPIMDDLITLFRDEFGFRNAVDEELAAGDILFTSDWPQLQEEQPVFVPWSPGDHV
ncbi:hypothetical protein [Burkholderia gladioli]|uniref:hypothetical protein n=1 Tax=Burkholderia gladioli TaxID=28095 RepID=UPI00163EB3CD|nr:hypothetical protein [Burkholderia gladioli]